MDGKLLNGANGVHIKEMGNGVTPINGVVDKSYPDEGHTFLQDYHEGDGLSVPLTITFLAGLTAGVGILALPHAMGMTGK